MMFSKVTEEIYKEERLKKDSVIFKIKEKDNDEIEEMADKKQPIFFEFRVSKSLLVGSSEVFEAMFRGSFSESSFGSVSVELNDTSEEVFAEFLKHMEGGQASLTIEKAVGLLYLSHKYMVESLQKLCYDYIYQQLDPDNFETVLNVCNILGTEEFESKVLLYYRMNPLEILRKKSFVEVSKEGLLKLVAMDKVNVREIEIFRACMRWVDARMENMSKERGLERELLELMHYNKALKYKPFPSRRSILGNQIIRNLRFPTMSLKEFREVVNYKELLTREEILGIKRCITKGTMLCWVGIVSHPRQSLWETCLDITDSLVETGLKKISVDELIFEAKCDIFFSGVGIFGRKDLNQVEVQVTIVEPSKTVKKSIMQATAGVRSNFSTPQKIPFNKPIKLKAYRTYQVKVFYRKDDSEGFVAVITDKKAGSAYKLQQMSKNCKDIDVLPASDSEQIYSNIPHIYYFKL